jgi:hypothetical protein
VVPESELNETTRQCPKGLLIADFNKIFGTGLLVSPVPSAVICPAVRKKKAASLTAYTYAPLCLAPAARKNLSP